MLQSTLISRHAIAHNMVTVLDGKAVVTGRFNFTKGQRRRMRRTANHRLTLAVDLTILADIGRTTASRFTRLMSLPKANTQPKGASLFARQKERLPEGSLFHIAATVRQVHPGYRGLVGSYRSMSVVPSRLLRFFEPTTSPCSSLSSPSSACL